MQLTQEQLAEDMCIPKSTISAYENDKVDVKSSVIIELADLLETSPDYLLGYGDDDLVVQIIDSIRRIKDRKVKEMLLIQIRALETA